MFYCIIFIVLRLSYLENNIGNIGAKYLVLGLYKLI